VLNQSHDHDDGEKNEAGEKGLSRVQKDFYKNGKSVAEELIKTIIAQDEQVDKPEGTSEKLNLTSAITVE
jgi:protein-disulfide isomerase-like protein with CxxC motif